MRAAIWIAVLFAAFVLAWQLQDRWASARRAERDAAYSRVALEGTEIPQGFGRVVIGEPSGAEPILVQEPPAKTSDSAATTRSPTSGGAQIGAIIPRSASESSALHRHVVRKGESLSKICAAFYGTARKDVVEAVARANGLTNAGAIREGQDLVLPTLDELRSAPR